MRKSIKLGALGAGGVAALALAGAALLPAGAETEPQDGSTTTQEQRMHGGREDHLREALADLVEDGTLTQDAADAVAEALADLDGPREDGRGGEGGRGGMALDTAADTLGLTADELREKFADGSTLAEVAKEQGVGTAELVDALVAAETERLDEAVADGRLTQDEADERAATIKERITEQVEQGFAGRGGPGGEPADGERPGAGDRANEASGEELPGDRERNGEAPDGERPGAGDRAGEGPQGSTDAPAPSGEKSA